MSPTENSWAQDLALSLFTQVAFEQMPYSNAD